MENKRPYIDLGFHIPSKPIDPPHQIQPLPPPEKDHGLTSYELLVECRDSKMKDVVRLVNQCLDTEAVLILGENGTGKELIARALHERGNRSKGYLSVVDCANLTPELMRSELFGHEKGAFSGAIMQRKGAFELADGGTVFLDEVGEIPLDLQAGLLRVLQGHSFKRVGGSTEITSNFNLITATNRDLREMVSSHKFRMDLFYRIEQFVIEVPPLRERVDDLVRLANHFVDEHSGRQKYLSEGAEELIRSHSWPGNVRELRNCIIRGVRFSNGTGTIEPADLRLRVQPNIQFAKATTNADVQSNYSVIELSERAIIVDMLKRMKGNKLASAVLLGIGRQTLYNKIKRYAIADNEY